ncbi:hypothetical protein [Kutzneria sp. NPDC052558]|uniref:hypothetical protein n=1 Tax=Kutzneria sp. NPDC052558 TaxID=3364121 RepID=UPI0037CBFF65
MSWGDIQGRRRVLQESAAEEEVVELAESAGFEKVREITAAPSEGVTREVTWRIAPRLYLHYLEYPPAETAIVQVTGDEFADVQRFDDLVTRYFEPISYEDVLDQLDREDGVEAKALLLRRLGLAAPNEPDPGFIAKVEELGRSSDVRLREAALWATLFPYWPEFIPFLDGVAESDPDEDLRAQAQFMADQIRKRQ